jgi:hypothetical protein
VLWPTSNGTVRGINPTPKSARTLHSAKASDSNNYFFVAAIPDLGGPPGRDSHIQFVVRLRYSQPEV